MTVDTDVSAVRQMKTSRQFLVFSCIGALGTAGHYTVLILLVQLAHIDPVFATTAGFIVGALINYVLNYRITFSSNKKHSEALLKFLTVAGLGGVMNAAIMSLGIDLLELHYLVIQVLATCIVLVFNFMANKYWTFDETGTFQ